jgi:RNA polymerase sigma-B factor
MTTISPGTVTAGTVTAGPLRSLAELDNQDLLVIAQSLPWTGLRQTAARELLVTRHRNLVRSCVQRYRRAAAAAGDEDLMQVGYVGLMKAINNFDPAVGGSLAAYAQPTIIGELKRHFRDHRWPVHVKRSAQELVLSVRAASGDLTQELGRAPAESDLARHLGVGLADLREARLAEVASQPSSLDAPLGFGAISLAEVLGEEDPRIEHMLAMRAVATHWDELPARERTVLMLRFHGNLTQAEIGQRIGVSQMQVSRLLSHALGYLRPHLLA